MTTQLGNRLKEHAFSLAAERIVSEDDNSPAQYSDIEKDLISAAAILLEHENMADLHAALGDELLRCNRLLQQSVAELQRYREWAASVKFAVGAMS